MEPQTNGSTALARRIDSFEPENLQQAEALANSLAKSSLLPEGLRGKPSDIYVTLITGHELGLSPMQAIRAIHIIKGKPSLSADLMVALVKRSPECVFFKLVKSDDTAATYSTERKDEGRTELTFTMEQARAAGLLQNDSWKKYPAAMLRARASSALARAVYPDLCMGIYDPEELRSEPSGPTEAPPEQVVVERKPAAQVVDAEFKPATEKTGPKLVQPQVSPEQTATTKILARLAKVESLLELDNVVEWITPRAAQLYGNLYESMVLPAIAAQRLKVTPPAPAPVSDDPPPAEPAQVDDTPPPVGSGAAAFDVLMDAFERAEKNRDKKEYDATKQAMNRTWKDSSVTGDQYAQLKARAGVVEAKLSAAP